MRIWRAIAGGLLVAILIHALLVAAESCPAGWIHSEGDLFTAGRCFGVEDGVIRSEPPGWQPML